MVLLSILAPFFSKRMIPEFTSLVMMLTIPLTWSSWSLPNPFTLGLMMDKLSVILIVLTLWTSMTMLLLKPLDNFLKLNIILLLLSLLWFFSVSSFLLLFITFEVSLIPTLCLIMGWGYQPERLEASFYFIFYTIIFSLPLMVSMIWLMLTSDSKYFYNSSLYEVSSSIMSFYILLVFMIKLPLFMVHFWLPKAHVEAPVVGSMILAGVLLKTGGYGIVRTFLYMNKSMVSMGYMIMGMVGMVYVCLVCLYCMDIKQLIAYSSVSHMNFMVVGMMQNSLSSYTGSIIMMVSHGVCSSLLFMLADFSYKRSGSRSVLVNKGFLLLVPPLSLAWGIIVLFNMGVPPSAGSISELLIISSCKTYSMMHSTMFVLYLFLSAFYSIYIYVCMNHGIPNKLAFTLEVKELLMTFVHMVPLTGLSLMMKYMSWI